MSLTLSIRTNENDQFKYTADIESERDRYDETPRTSIDLYLLGFFEHSEDTANRINKKIRNISILKNNVTYDWCNIDDTILTGINDVGTTLINRPYGVVQPFVFYNTVLYMSLKSDFFENRDDSITTVPSTDDADVLWLNKLVRVVPLWTEPVLGTFVKRDGTSVLLKSARFLGTDTIHDLMWVQYKTLRLPTNDESSKWRIRNQELLK